MELRVTRLILGGSLLYGLTLIPSLSQKYEASQARKSQSEEIRQENSLDRALAKDAISRSATALERVKAGCAPVVTKVKSKVFEEPFVEGSPVVTDGSRSRLGQGSFVCNSTGATAAIVLDPDPKKGSVMAAIANAAPADMDEYRALFADNQARFSAQPQTQKTAIAEAQ
jgi:hypothetical protein